MRWESVALQCIAESVSLGRMSWGARRGLRVLMYHSVGSSAYGDDTGLYGISEERFREHLDLIGGDGLVPTVPLGMPGNELQTVITFDDGYRDNLSVAAPLLVERGLPFTVFVASDLVRTRESGFLSPSELRELSLVNGATIGAHGCSHCNLTQCSKDKLRSELEGSKKYLEDTIGKSVSSVAYPYGAANIRVRDAAISAGYSIGACSRFDINDAGRDLLMLNRCVVLANDTTRVLRQKLRGDWDWYRWRSADPLRIMDSSA